MDGPEAVHLWTELAKKREAAMLHQAKQVAAAEVARHTLGMVRTILAVMGKNIAETLQKLDEDGPEGEECRRRLLAEIQHRAETW